MSSRKGHSKSDNFEIDLMPVISILAVVISLLLTTGVWLSVGSFELSQALGSEAATADADKKPTLWIELAKQGSAQFEIKKGTRVVTRINSRSPVREIERIAEELKGRNPDLKTALVLPAPNSRYQDLIRIMDVLKKNNISDIGLAPL